MTTIVARSPFNVLVPAVLAATLILGCGGDPSATDETAPIQQAATATARPENGAVVVNTGSAGATVGATSTAGSAATDSTKCPERIEGGGAGDLQGGMCVYPKPAGGCSALGSDCNDVYGEAKCRCPQKSIGTSSPGAPGQVMSQ